MGITAFIVKVDSSAVKDTFPCNFFMTYTIDLVP